MGGAGHPRLRDRAVRRDAGDRPRSGGHGHRAALEPPRGVAVMPGLGSPLVLEAGLGLLILVVFFVGLFHRSDDRRRVGVITAVGLTVLLALSWRAEPGGPLLGGSFANDDLAIFAKRLFLVATIIGVLGALGLRTATFARRATEYHVAILASLLGMLVLASARELILLFVAFEL